MPFNMAYWSVANHFVDLGMRGRSFAAGAVTMPPISNPYVWSFRISALSICVLNVRDSLLTPSLPAIVSLILTDEFT